jgi:Holliday junction resolvasome RuvABC DNA-binding subunit
MWMRPCARVDAEHEASVLLETIPGVGQRTAQALVAQDRR